MQPLLSVTFQKGKVLLILSVKVAGYSTSNVQYALISVGIDKRRSKDTRNEKAIPTGNEYDRNFREK